MEKIVNTQTSIFNENSKRKVLKITFMLCSLLCFTNIQSSFAQNSNKLVVPVKCAGYSNQKYEECAKACNNVSGSQVSSRSCSTSNNGNSNTVTHCSGSDIYQYTATNGVLSFSQQCSGNGRCYDGDTEVRNSVINQCKASCEFFKNQCSSYIVEIDTVKFLEAMPEIGISRVDPNLIEY